MFIYVTTCNKFFCLAKPNSLELGFWCGAYRFGVSESDCLVGCIEEPRNTWSCSQINELILSFSMGTASDL